MMACVRAEQCAYLRTGKKGKWISPLIRNKYEKNTVDFPWAQDHSAVDVCSSVYVDRNCDWDSTVGDLKRSDQETEYF